MSKRLYSTVSALLLHFYSVAYQLITFSTETTLKLFQVNTHHSFLPDLPQPWRCLPGHQQGRWWDGKSITMVLLNYTRLTETFTTDASAKKCKLTIDACNNLDNNQVSDIVQHKRIWKGHVNISCCDLLEPGSNFDCWSLGFPFPSPIWN